MVNNSADAPPNANSVLCVQREHETRAALAPRVSPARMLGRGDERAESGMAVSDAELAEGLLARTESLVPLLRANALATEREGRVAAENSAALEQAGVFRMTAPIEAGGYELPVLTQVEVLATPGSR